MEKKVKITIPKRFGIDEEIEITIPEGYEIDKENSTFECIKFKPINKSKFSDYDGTYPMAGYYMNDNKIIFTGIAKNNFERNKDVFSTEKYAKSAFAMAQISQIMANDERFGGVITDEEWEDSNIPKYCLCREHSYLQFSTFQSSYEFLAFHTPEQRDLFYQENRQLINDYLMID